MTKILALTVLVMALTACSPKAEAPVAEVVPVVEAPAAPATEAPAVVAPDPAAVVAAAPAQ